MLVLGRKKGEIVDIFVEERRIMSITVSDIVGHKNPFVRLGFSADKSVKVLRRELSSGDGEPCKT